MPNFIPRYIASQSTNIMRSSELPHTVKDARLFHEDFAFLDYFCLDDETGRFVFCFPDLVRFFNKKGKSPCEVRAYRQTGPKWDMNWRNWFEQHGKGNIVTILAGEKVALPEQIYATFYTF